MAHARRQFGNNAERDAARFLKRLGMKVLERQFTTRYGEIDLIVQDGSEVVFVEVKARRTSDFGFPEESVTPRKLEKIRNVAEMYLSTFSSVPDHRIDVVSIVYKELEHKIFHLKAVG